MNCLLKEFAICVDVTEGLLLKEIVLFLFVCIFLLERFFRVFHRVCEFFL